MVRSVLFQFYIKSLSKTFPLFEKIKRDEDWNAVFVAYLFPVQLHAARSEMCINMQKQRNFYQVVLNEYKFKVC